MNNLGPEYLSCMFTRKRHARKLRSSSDDLKLDVPKMRLKTIGERAFSAYAPHIWNSLPYDLRAVDELDDFKRKLKTHLFKSAYK